MVVLFTCPSGSQLLKSRKFQRLELLLGHNGVAEWLALVGIEAWIFKFEDVRVFGKEILNLHFE